MTKRMLIDDTQPEETRVVIVDGNKAKEYKLYPPDGKVQIQYHDFTEDYYNNPVRKAISAVSSKIGPKC